MAPQTRSTLEKLEADTKEFPCFTHDSKILLCSVCGDAKIKPDRLSTVTTHVTGKRRLAKISEKEKKQPLITNRIKPKPTPFSREIADLLESLDIPLQKLDSQKFKDFLFRHHKEHVSVTTARNCLKSLYEEKIAFLKNILVDKKVWISFDETTDSAGRYVANFIIGLLENNDYYLGNIGFLEKTNSTTVSRFVLESLSLLGINYDNVLASITDGVAYMTKAVESLQVPLQKKVHINCLAHNLNRVADKVVEICPELNELISLGKQVFLKAPLRREKLLAKI